MYAVGDTQWGMGEEEEELWHVRSGGHMSPVGDGGGEEELWHVLTYAVGDAQ